jgi:hypothetical protein
MNDHKVPFPGQGPHELGLGLDLGLELEAG